MRGGSSAVLIEKTITENGTYNAVDDEADGYSTVNIEVANTYTNEDEGKVVDSGVLVAQTARETEITENGIYDTTLNNSITVNVSAPTPTPGVKSGAVIRDYDGSIIASYTPAQFAALSAYPAQPVHTGLTVQGYNWSLAGAKAYVAKYGYVEVGATYITDDGKTRYYIVITQANTEGTISLGLNGTAVIDWGDGSETDTITGEDIETNIDTSHNYTTVGKYTITIDVTNGSAFLVSISEYFILGKVEIGSRVTSIGSSAFSNCQALTSITISEGVTSIDIEAFYNCYALTSITIPEGVTELGDDAFDNCYALTSITIPEGVTLIGNSAFSNCYALTSIAIPEGVAEIGGYVFSYCYALTSIAIPESVTSISDYAFSYCQALTSITIPEGVTSISDYAFYYCYSLTSITIPEGVTSIGDSAFYTCYALTSITIPEGVTSISDYAFANCYALTSITIPEGVTSIEGSAFSSCYALTSITFEPTTPPAISSSTFENINPFCTIYVPTGTLEAYTTAPDYPDPTIYTYVEY